MQQIIVFKSILFWNFKSEAACNFHSWLNAGQQQLLCQKPEGDKVVSDVTYTSTNLC